MRRSERARSYYNAGSKPTTVAGIHVRNEHLSRIQTCYHVGMLLHIRAAGYA